MDVGGFRSFTTDVLSSADVYVARSLSGDNVHTESDDQPISGQVIIVRTDAIDFDDKGYLHIETTFEPMGKSVSGSLTTFRPVPEPASAGILLIAGACLLGPLRQRPTRVPPPAATH
jgi:hypothetical protein